MKKKRGILSYKSPYEYYKSVKKQVEISKTKDYFNYLVQNQFDMYAIRGGEDFLNESIAIIIIIVSLN